MDATSKQRIQAAVDTLDQLDRAVDLHIGSGDAPPTFILEGWRQQLREARRKLDTALDRFPMPAPVQLQQRAADIREMDMARRAGSRR